MPSLLHPGRVIALAHGARPAARGFAMSTDYSALLTEFLSLLERRGVPFVVVGGIALLQHVTGRNTEDLDLILSAPRLAELPELELRERNDLFASGHFGELRVDVLFAEHPLFRRVSENFSQPMPYEVGPLRTATVDGLLLLKLFALPSLYRQYDFDRTIIYEGDIAQLLARSGQPNAWFLEQLRPHLLPGDLEKLSRVLSEARVKLRRGRPPA